MTLVVSKRKTKSWSCFCLDPGETTGWAWALFSEAEMKGTEKEAIDGAVKNGRFRYGQIRCDYSNGWILGEASAVCRIASEIRDADAIVRSTTGLTIGINQVTFEDFILRERTKARDLLSPVRITSGVIAALEVDEFDWFVGNPQSPSNAKTTMTNDRLQRLGVWIPGQQHARDAIRHLILARRTRVIDKW